MISKVTEKGEFSPVKYVLKYADNNAFQIETRPDRSIRVGRVCVDLPQWCSDVMM